MTTAYILLTLVLYFLAFTRNLSKADQPPVVISPKARRMAAIVQAILILFGSAALLFG